MTIQDIQHIEIATKQVNMYLRNPSRVYLTNRIGIQERGITDRYNFPWIINLIIAAFSVKANISLKAVTGEIYNITHNIKCADWGSARFLLDEKVLLTYRVALSSLINCSTFKEHRSVLQQAINHLDSQLLQHYSLHLPQNDDIPNSKCKSLWAQTLISQNDRACFLINSYRLFFYHDIPLNNDNWKWFVDRWAKIAKRKGEDGQLTTDKNRALVIDLGKRVLSKDEIDRLKCQVLQMPIASNIKYSKCPCVIDSLVALVL